MSNSQSQEVIQSLLQCPGCLSSFDLGSREPRRLNCMHTVCLTCILLECVARKDGSVPQCPLCSLSVSVLTGVREKDSVLQKIPRNESIWSLLDAMKRASSGRSGESERPLCDDGCGNRAEVRCDECKCSLCEVCNREIHSRVVLSTHRRVKIESVSTSVLSSARCSHHSAEFTHFCFDCGDLLCDAEKNAEHATHHVSSVAEAAVDIRKRVESTRRPLTAQVERARMVIDRLESAESNLQDSLERVRGDLKRVRNRLALALAARNDNLLRAATDIADTEEKKITEHIKLGRDFVGNLSHVTLASSRSMDERMSLVMLATYQNLIAQMHRSVALPLDFFAQYQPQTIVSAIDPSIHETISNFGSLCVIQRGPIGAALGMMKSTDSQVTGVPPMDSSDQELSPSTPDRAERVDTGRERLEETSAVVSDAQTSAIRADDI